MESLPVVRARIVRRALRPGRLDRVGALTPYLVETIAADLRRGGEAVRLEVEVVGDADEAALAWVRNRFAPLRAIRIRVVRRRARCAAA